jgi:cardiolipin hydrolase
MQIITNLTADAVYMLQAPLNPGDESLIAPLLETISKKTNVSLQLVPTGDCYISNVLLMHGNNPNMIEASIYIFRDLMNHHAVPIEMFFFCLKKSSVFSIIGHGGSTIRKIETECDVKVRVPKGTSADTEVVCAVYGQSSNVERAERAIREAVYSKQPEVCFQRITASVNKTTTSPVSAAPETLAAVRDTPLVAVQGVAVPSAVEARKVEGPPSTDYDNQLTDVLSHAIDGSLNPHVLRDLLKNVALPKPVLNGVLNSGFAAVSNYANKPGVTASLVWLNEVTQVVFDGLLNLATDKTKGSEYLFFPSHTAVDKVLETINSAKVSLHLCVSQLMFDTISDAILAAYNRGVVVQIVSDNKSIVAESDVLHLWQRGIKVKLDKSLCRLHHNFCIIDNRIVMSGSFSWTKSSTSREDCVIHCDPAAVIAFNGQFESMWSSFCAV